LFWFQIRGVKFSDSDVKIRVKCLKKVDELNTTQDKPNLSRLSDTSESDQSQFDVSQIQWKEIAILWVESVASCSKEFLYYKVNRENINRVLCLLGLLIVSIVTSSISLIKWVGNLSIRLIFELSRLVHVCTPLFLGLLDFLSKIIGGVFIFLAMLWKDCRKDKGGQMSAAPRQLALQCRQPYEPVYKKALRTYR